MSMYDIVWSCGTDRIVTDYATYSCMSINMTLLYCLAFIGLAVIITVMVGYIANN